MQVRNPRTGAFDYAIAPLAAVAVAAEARRLREAQPLWAALTPEERGTVLSAFADAIEKHAGAIADALTIDTGRRKISQVEVAAVTASIRRWAGAAPGIIDKLVDPPRPSAIPSIETVGRLEPYALVGAIAPWNFPLILSLIDVVPALAAGCAAMVKPSEITPRFIAPLRAALAEVPQLAAVFAIVEGDGATGAALVDAVDFIAFTGSVATGRKVAERAARALIPASLELGGKDPMIVLASAQPDYAAAIALRGSIANTGQACQSIERVYVLNAIAAPFLSALVAQAEAVRLNYPDIDVGDIGPFIDGRQARIVEAQLADAVANGAVVHTGGTVETLGGGLYLRPTVLTGVTQEMAIMAEETFGPVIPVTVVDTVDEAVRLANDTPFGLSASVMAGSIAEGEAVAARIRAGAVSINDAGLTAMVWDREKSSFGASGLGPSRMGESAILRFFRRQALFRQHGEAQRLTMISEDGG
ncbi:MAG TPA: aldehyde dehydrogenase family protein [Sphingobium sp.]